MKILMITPYVTILGKPEFEKNKTGFGYMVMDIARAVRKFESVEVLATDSRGEAFEQDGVLFLKRSLSLYFSRLLHCLSPGSILRLRRKYPMQKRTFLRLIYYWLMTGYLHSLLKKGEYDIVHIHGCGFATEQWMSVCKLCGQKFVVTLHGLNSFSDSVSLEPAGKQYERDFLERVVKGEFSITVISSGMKRLIEKTYNNSKESKNISVVCNSFDFNSHITNAGSIKFKYNIPQEGRVLLSVGNITKNKNQIQLVRAFGLLPDLMQQNTYVLFCGRLDSSCGVEKELEKQKYASHLIMCGGVPKTELPSYYVDADCVILLSYAEGFGLSLIEGMHFGKPCVTFEDLASFKDIYDPSCVIGIHGREDKDVMGAIENCLTMVWNNEEIVKKSKRFEAGTMAKNYMSVYSNIKES